MSLTLQNFLPYSLKKGGSSSIEMRLAKERAKYRETRKVAIEPRRYQMRVPYRGKNGLKSVGRGGAPTIGEVGVDRLVLKINAYCRLASGNDLEPLNDYFQSFPDFTASELTDWFQTPSDPSRALYQRLATLRNRSAMRQTLGHVDVGLNAPRRGRGWKASITIEANPTRTLAHLLTRFLTADASAFVESIANLSVADFFSSQEGVALSLDGNTNWIEFPDQLVARLGSDPYATFLPIYLAKIQQFAEIVTSSGAMPEFSEEGEVLVMRAAGVEVTIDTSAISIPQSEIFIERYHGQAVAGMREAALSAIDQLRDVESTFFLGNDGAAPQEGRSTVARRASSLQLTSSLPHQSKLAIYPKAERRIRFEMRRNRSFSWGDSRVVFQQPMQRVLARINQDRARWIEGGSALRWENVFAFFDEPTRPHIGDMAELIAAISEVAARHNAPVGKLVSKLIIDGGVSPNEIEGVSTNVLGALERAGVVNKVMIARRGGAGSAVRYSLREHYLTVVQEMALLPTIRDEIM